MSNTTLNTAARLVSRNESNASSLRSSLIRSGILPINSRLDNLPQKLLDLKAQRFLAPAGTRINLILDQDIQSASEAALINSFVRERRHFGIGIDSDVDVVILSEPQGLKMFAGLSKSTSIIPQAQPTKPVAPSRHTESLEP